MFGALGRFVSRHPWYVIVAWVLLAVVVVATAPKLTTTSDQSEVNRIAKELGPELGEKTFEPQVLTAQSTGSVPQGLDGQDSSAGPPPSSH
ncbi:MAG: hypothetical protein L0H93_11375 [Nocardioides sp.]|nr:hypothetical protein [Nocardioides sp.]